MWIKICGLTSPDQACQIAALKPSAVGLNFYRASRRGITPELAREISQQIPADILKVGVFVDQSPADILDITNLVGLDLIQLHGDYTPSDALQLGGRPFLWVHRMGHEGLGRLRQSLKELHELNLQPFGCLIDAEVPGHYGGSGHSVDWTRLREEYPCEFPPLILAGGLHADNIQQAIRMVNPWGVDVASGVETNGVKDVEKCQRFLEQASNAV